MIKPLSLDAEWFLTHMPDLSGLSHAVIEVLEWAREKYLEEKEMEKSAGDDVNHVSRLGFKS